MKAIKFIAYIVLTIQSLQLQANNTQHIWLDMQQKYDTLCQELSKRTNFSEKDYCHSYWADAKEKIKNVIHSNDGINFVKEGQVAGNMIRESKHTDVQNYELHHLNYCLDPQLKKLIFSYKDETLLPIAKDCQEFNCSHNTLGHLYYASKLLEQTEQMPQIIVEFGAGYGNLGRVFKTLIPESTIILIDLPELLALEYFFLKSTMPDVNVIMHTQEPATLEKNAIHLLPVFFIENIEIKADAFISTFALSESSKYTQNLVAKKDYFNASTCYIVGQLGGWGTFNFVNHEAIFKNLRSKYKKTTCHPFHSLLNQLKSYEIMATNK